MYSIFQITSQAWALIAMLILQRKKLRTRTKTSAASPSYRYFSFLDRTNRVWTALMNNSYGEIAVS